MRTWEFTDVEFKVLCYRYRNGSVPSPLVYTARTLYEDEYEQELAETRSELDGKLDRSFGAIFEALVQPDVFIVSHAWCDSDMDNPEKRIRVHGARRDRRACLVIQKPAETLYHSAGFTFIECEPEELPGLVVDYLPEAGAGQLPAMTLVTEPAEADPYEYEAPRSGAFDSFDESIESRSVTFWQTPAEWTGAVKVMQGRSKYGPRGIQEATMIWRDLPGDGRYLIEMHTAEATAVGADAKRLVERMDQRVQQVLTHMENRGEVAE
ncbi:ESX secretion-associated protein EspG [Nocardia sp. NPDC127526]|uniref:ESX secretion-associated protein EspG n=1 Tax=Nocardia sp. NPDC127526 TaxID=3345393 RepID=UPI003631A2D4